MSQPITWKNVASTAGNNAGNLIKGAGDSLNKSLNAFKGLVSNVADTSDQRQQNVDNRDLQNYQDAISRMTAEQQQEALTSPEYSAENILSQNPRINPNDVRNQILQRGKDIITEDNANHARKEELRSRANTQSVRDAFAGLEGMFINPDISNAELQARKMQLTSTMDSDAAQEFGAMFDTRFGTARALNDQYRTQAEIDAENYDTNNYLNDREIVTKKAIPAVPAVLPNKQQQAALDAAEAEVLDAELAMSLLNNPGYDQSDADYLKSNYETAKDNYNQLAANYTKGAPASAAVTKTVDGINTVKRNMVNLERDHVLDGTNPFDNTVSVSRLKGQVIDGTYDRTWGPLKDGDGGEDLESELNEFITKNKDKLNPGNFKALLESMGKEVDSEGKPLFVTKNLGSRFQNILLEEKKYKEAKKLYEGYASQLQKLEKARAKGNKSFKISNENALLKKQLQAAESLLRGKQLLSK